jgi:hypothetical protein
VSFLYVVRLSLMKGEVMADPSLGVQPGSLSWASVIWVFARLTYRGPLDLLTNRCLEIPEDHNRDTYVCCNCFHLAVSNVRACLAWLLSASALL